MSKAGYLNGSILDDNRSIIFASASNLTLKNTLLSLHFSVLESSSVLVPPYDVLSFASLFQFPSPAVPVELVPIFPTWRRFSPFIQPNELVFKNPSPRLDLVGV